MPASAGHYRTSHDRPPTPQGGVVAGDEAARGGAFEGQRRFIEDRIAAIIGIWGEEAFAGIAVEEPEHPEGPQLEGQGISQDDIDALFD
jgi:hypothetical protein